MEHVCFILTLNLFTLGYEYRVPPIWKRFAAEFIDSTMLFLLKFSITFIAIDVFDFMYVKGCEQFSNIRKSIDFFFLYIIN